MIDLRRYALGATVMVAMLAGCGGGSGGPMSPSPAGVSAERTRPDATYKVVYSFGGGSGNGADPWAGLTDVGWKFKATGRFAILTLTSQDPKNSASGAVVASITITKNK